MGRGGRVAGHSPVPGRFGEVPRRPEGRAAPFAGRGPPVRRVPLHRPRRGRAHPRDERHDGPPDCVRPRVRGLGADRRGARAHPLGGGHPPRRPRPHLLVLQSLPGLVGGAPWRGAARRDGVPVRRGRPRPDADGGRVGPRAQADGVLRDALVRAPLRGDVATRGHRPADLRLAHPVLFRSAGRGHPRDEATDRGDVRRAVHGHGVDGRDDAVDDERRVPPPDGHAPLAGPRLHSGVRPRHVRAAPVRRRGHARVHAPRAQLATDDPPRLRRPRPLDGRAVPVRADVSATAGRALRADRRYVHRPGREYLPERDRGHAARDRRVRRRVSGHRLAPRDDGRALDPRRVRREPRRSRAPGEALRHGDRAAPRAARGPPRRRARPRGHLAAYRVQGSPSHRRPRSLPSRPPGGASVSPHVETLARQVVEGSPRATARALTWVESGGPRAEALAARLYRHTGRAHVVGITGAPGSGKSTLARALTRVARGRGKTVGILAVDPSSPFTGGAILGDRIRMNDLALDPGVFIRSMATRGALGGLSRAAADAVDLMDAAGLGLVLVETVGVGQDEVDVMRLAHTIIVVSAPGLGDDVQALKAGVLEIADVHVVNKADREGADRTVAELRAMLTRLRTPEAAWVPPVLAASAARDEGIEAIADALDGHMAFLKTSGELERRRRRIVTARVLKIAQDLVAETVLEPFAAAGTGGATLLDRVTRRELTPHACARALLARTANRIDLAGEG